MTLPRSAYGTSPSDADAPPSGVERVAPESSQRPPLVCSEQLMKGHRAIEISHNGELYRLQRTRQGKLILTK